MGYGCTIGVDGVVVPLSRIQISDRRGRCESGSADLYAAGLIDLVGQHWAATPFTAGRIIDQEKEMSRVL